jgi:hypothetical protein
LIGDRAAQARTKAWEAQGIDRLQWQIAELRASLDKIAAAHAAMAAELN